MGMEAVNTYLHTMIEDERNMARTAAISIRVEPELKVVVEKAAKADKRTVAQWVELLIVERLQERGFLAKDESAD